MTDDTLTEGFESPILEADGFRHVPSVIAGKQGLDPDIRRAALDSMSLEERYAITLRMLANLTVAVAPLPNRYLPEDHDDEVFFPSDLQLGAIFPTDMYDLDRQLGASLTWLAVAVRRDLKHVLGCHKGADECDCWTGTYNSLAIGEMAEVAVKDEDTDDDYRAAIEGLPAWPATGENAESHEKLLSEAVEGAIERFALGNRQTRLAAEAEGRRHSTMSNIGGNLAGILGMLSSMMGDDDKDKN